MTVFVAASTAKTHDLLGPALTGAFKEVLTMWPVLLLAAAVVLVKVAVAVRRQRRLARSGIADVDRMDGTTFEAFLATKFRRLGYAVEATRQVELWDREVLMERLLAANRRPKT